jgi:methionyl-tRNA formyltransferase
MGTPDFAARALERLYGAGHDVCCVFTQPDKPKNRGLKLTEGPVKELARGRSPIYQPETLRGGEAENQLRGHAPELIAVVAYGKLLPPEILALPPRGCVNIHGSLLPKYRGAAPIQRAVINGETVTGVTSMYMAEELDAGDIIFAKATEIGETETSGALFDRLAALGAELLMETVDAIAAGTAPRTAQNVASAPVCAARGAAQSGADATFAPPLTRAEAELDWSKPTRELLNKIRGMNPWPVARATLGGVDFKIFSAISGAEEGLRIPCADGVITVTELQAPGGKRLAAADYLRGHPICL